MPDYNKEYVKKGSAAEFRGNINEALNGMQEVVDTIPPAIADMQSKTNKAIDDMGAVNTIQPAINNMQSQVNTSIAKVDPAIARIEQYANDTIDRVEGEAQASIGGIETAIHESMEQLEEMSREYVADKSIFAGTSTTRASKDSSLINGSIWLLRADM